MASSVLSSTTSSQHSDSRQLAEPSHWDSLNSPLIQDEGDGKSLKLRFDVSQYTPEEIVVKTVDNKLLVSSPSRIKLIFFLKRISQGKRISYWLNSPTYKASRFSKQVNCCWKYQTWRWRHRISNLEMLQLFTNEINRCHIRSFVIVRNNRLEVTFKRRDIIPV